MVGLQCNSLFSVWKIYVRMSRCPDEEKARWCKKIWLLLGLKNDFPCPESCLLIADIKFLGSMVWVLQLTDG